MQTLQADYFAAYRHLRLSRDDQGVLIAEFHSDGGPFIMALVAVVVNGLIACNSCTRIAELFPAPMWLRRCRPPPDQLPTDDGFVSASARRPRWLRVCGQRKLFLALPRMPPIRCTSV